MSAYRQAMLAVAPERLEQFSLEMQQNIDENDRKKKKSTSTSSKPHKRHKTKKESEKTKQKPHRGSKKVTSKKKAESKKRSKSKSGKTIKEKRKRRNSDEQGRLTGDSDVEENGLNLEKELFSLSYYVKDRRHLLEQVFQIVKGPKLGAMLPDVLKNIPLEDLKQKCFEQLDVMSSKRIHHVLAGKTMDSSSGTDSSDNENREAIPKLSHTKTTFKEQPSVQANFVDSTTTSGCEVVPLVTASSNVHREERVEEESAFVSDKSEDGSEEGEVTSEEEEITLVEEEEVDSSEVEEIETVEVVEDEYQEMVDEILEETMPATSGEHVDDEQSQRTQLELLELQMRERAIKSLMRAAGKLEDDEKQ